jgi:hypothetical protein
MSLSRKRKAAGDWAGTGTAGTSPIAAGRAEAWGGEEADADWIGHGKVKPPTQRARVSALEEPTTEGEKVESKQVQFPFPLPPNNRETTPLSAGEVSIFFLISYFFLFQKQFLEGN